MSVLLNEKHALVFFLVPLSFLFFFPFLVMSSYSGLVISQRNNKLYHISTGRLFTIFYSFILLVLHAGFLFYNLIKTELPKLIIY